MEDTSRTAIGMGDGKFSIETTLLSSPKEDEVLVRIKAAGLCHTDYDSLFWKKILF